MADKVFSTPPGIAVYPRLRTPDMKFDELGIYKADVAVPKAEASGLIKELQAIHKDHTGKPAKVSENTMFMDEVDDEGNETGNVIFKLRIKNRLNKKGEVWDRKPKQFDAQLRPIDVNPWGGSKMVVSFTVYTWNAGDKKGVSLQPQGVQILELVTGTGASPEGMGFKAQEGYSGYSEGAGETDDVSEDDAEGTSDDDEVTDGADY